jgi:hypothetical protein
MMVTVPTSGPLGLCVEWNPSVPEELSESSRGEYRSGRDRLLGEVAKSLGVSIGVVELEKQA